MQKKIFQTPCFVEKVGLGEKKFVHLVHFEIWVYAVVHALSSL